MACRGVLRPPQRSAIGLIEWGLDLWPYVNGKCILNGIRLESLEASDMLDVLHYLLEDAFDVSSAEQAQARDQIRTTLYKDFYGKTYKYAAKKKNDGFSTASGFDDQEFAEENKLSAEEDSDIKPFNPRYKEPTKPFTPATEVGPDMLDPFGGVLDSPLG